MLKTQVMSTVGCLVREADTMWYLECMSCSKEDLGIDFNYLKSFHLKKGLYLSPVVPEGRTRISEQKFLGSRFQLKIRNYPLSP